MSYRSRFAGQVGLEHQGAAYCSSNTCPEKDWELEAKYLGGFECQLAFYHPLALKIKTKYFVLYRGILTNLTMVY